MAKKSSLNDTDLKAFEEAMKGVKRLEPTKIRLNQPESKPLPYKKNWLENEEVDYIPLFEREYQQVNGDTALSYKHNSISDKILRKLRKGQYTIHAKLDLHGMTAQEAKTTLEQFFSACLKENIGTALIVHGKGRHALPILKNKLNSWLREAPFILAFCSAAAKHGGQGAVYVLLKKCKFEEE